MNHTPLVCDRSEIFNTHNLDLYKFSSNVFYPRGVSCVWLSVLTRPLPSTTSFRSGAAYRPVTWTGPALWLRIRYTTKHLTKSQMRLSHVIKKDVALLAATEFYALNPRTNKLVREYRAPKSLKPHLTVLADDLLHAYQHGVSVRDMSMTTGTMGHHFRCRCILLFWTGDYPAQSSVSGMSSSRCHWCHFQGTYFHEVNRTCFCDHRQFLPTSHPFRRDRRFGRHMTSVTPESRVHEEVVDDAVRNEKWSGAASAAPWKTTGVKRLSPLCALPMWDIVWDITPDMMHLNDNVFGAHIMATLSGKRHPIKPKPKQSMTSAANAVIMDKWEKQVALHDVWKLSDLDQNVLYRYMYISFLPYTLFVA